MTFCQWLQEPTNLLALAAVVGLLPTLGQVFCKFRSDSIESHIRISMHFAQLVGVANARGDGYFSEAMAEKLLSCDAKRRSNSKEVWGECADNLPVGLLSQKAAIDMIAELGRKYRILRRPAALTLGRLASDPLTENVNACAQQALVRLRTRRLPRWARGCRKLRTVTTATL